MIARLGLKIPNDAVGARPSRYDAAGDVEFEYYADSQLVASWRCGGGQAFWYRVDSLADYLALIGEAVP
jgi:hypothetical protein